LLVLVGVIIAALIIWDRAKFGVFLTALLTVVPALVGLLFLFGHPTPKRAAYAVSVGIPPPIESDLDNGKLMVIR